MKYDAKSDVGQRRDANEDAYFVSAERGIAAVADGMGGHAAGEVASRIVVDTLRDCLAGKNAPASDDGAAGPAADRLRDAIREANRRIFETIELQQELRGMGTTVVAAIVDSGHLTIAYVGDSRAYLLRDGELRQLTADHSWVQEQVSLGLLSPAEANRHPFRNIVTRALGTREDVPVDICEEKLRAEDRLLLCSDGLNSMIGDDRIRDILQKAGGDIARACAGLVEAANEAGGEDNVTVVLGFAEPEG